MTKELDRLLEAARTAGPMDRIGYRDRIAAEGEAAVPALADWLRQPGLGAFAVRVLTRIGQEPSSLAAVGKALAGAQTVAPTEGVRGDIADALVELGLARPRRAGAAAPRVRREDAAPGKPGVPGRRYWAMRTSPDSPDVIWAEVRRGRLRQGWGGWPQQDLRIVADRLARGEELDETQASTRLARRMLETEPDGIREGDLIVTQNLPRPGCISVCRVVGAYAFEILENAQDFGHILPVELLVEDQPRGGPYVTEALRRAIAMPPRLREITSVGGDVEELVSAARA
jgi:hypothetical protein